MNRLIICAIALAALGCATAGAGTNDGLRQVGQTESTAGAMTTGAIGSTSHALYTTSDLGVETTVPLSLDAAYAAVMRGYLSLGIDVLTRDDAAHMVGNKRIVVMHSLLGHRASDFFDCGVDPAIGGLKANQYRLTISVVSTLTAGGNGQTLITTKASAQGEDMGTSATPVYCQSSGLIERTIVKASGLQSS